MRGRARLLRAEERFDLLITELFFTDCLVTLAHRLRAPHMYLSSGPLLPWGYARFGVPNNPALVGAFFAPHSDTFSGRVRNTVLRAAHHALYRLWFVPREQALVDALVPGAEGAPRVRVKPAGTRMSSGLRSWIEACPSPMSAESTPPRRTSSTFSTPA